LAVLVTARPAADTSWPTPATVLQAETSQGGGHDGQDQDLAHGEVSEVGEMAADLNLGPCVAFKRMTAAKSWRRAWLKPPQRLPGR
jgi:hypothetical protein